MKKPLAENFKLSVGVFFLSFFIFCKLIKSYTLPQSMQICVNDKKDDITYSADHERII